MQHKAPNPGPYGPYKTYKIDSPSNVEQYLMTEEVQQDGMTFIWRCPRPADHVELVCRHMRVDIIHSHMHLQMKTKGLITMGFRSMISDPLTCCVTLGSRLVFLGVLKNVMCAEHVHLSLPVSWLKEPMECSIRRDVPQTMNVCRQWSLECVVFSWSRYREVLYNMLRQRVLEYAEGITVLSNLIWGYMDPTSIETATCMSTPNLWPVVERRRYHCSLLRDSRTTTPGNEVCVYLENKMLVLQSMSETTLIVENGDTALLLAPFAIARRDSAVIGFRVPEKWSGPLWIAISLVQNVADFKDILFV